MIWIILNGVLSLGLAAFYALLVVRVTKIMVSCSAATETCTYSFTWPILIAVLTGMLLVLSVFNLFEAYRYYKKEKAKFPVWLWYNLPLYLGGFFLYLATSKFDKAALFALFLVLVLLAGFRTKTFKTKT